MCASLQPPRFEYAPLYFSANLTNGIKDGVLLPTDGASESHDADVGMRATGTSSSLYVRPASLREIVRAVLQKFGSGESNAASESNEVMTESYVHTCRFLEARRFDLRVRLPRFA